MRELTKSSTTSTMEEVIMATYGVNKMKTPLNLLLQVLKKSVPMVLVEVETTHTYHITRMKKRVCTYLRYNKYVYEKKVN